MLIAATCVAVLGTGCTSSSELADVRSQLDAVELQVLQLQKDAATRTDIDNAQAALSAQLTDLVELHANLTSELRQVAGEVEALGTKVDETSFRLTQMTQQLSAATQELQTLRDLAETVRSGDDDRRASNPRPSSRASSSGATASDDPQALYDAAYNDYVAGNLDLAILGFRQLLESFPAGELTDNATYWLGESYYRQSRFEDAIEQFDQVLTRFPRSDRIASALLKKGYAYLELGQRAQGVVQLQRVICDHAGTDEAKLATSRLRELGLSPDC